MKHCTKCGSGYNEEAFAVCPKCKPMVFQTWGHSFGQNMDLKVEGETLGQIVDKAVNAFGVTPEGVHGIKLEVNGLVIKLRRPGKAGE